MKKKRRTRTPPRTLMVPEITLTVPIPPSANKIYVAHSNSRRYKSDAYKSWLYACHAVLLPPLPRIPKHRSIHADLTFGIGYRRDLDNCIKPTLDMLQVMGVILDDRYVDEIVARRGGTRDEAVITLRVAEEATPPLHHPLPQSTERQTESSESALTATCSVSASAS